ncbi:AAA family ATPase [Sorangium sp. So ce542]|uniref:AAA family ATPase n=1 Tax=Sorangium sp. So ce542 TaxID=3133316 RepID=UPI003F62590C
MSLTSFSVEGYRSFVRRTTVDLRPLTLLFGYNSAGKSALVRALPLLSASCGGGNVGPLALDAEALRKPTYADIATRISSRNKLAFGLTWNDDECPITNIEITLREDDKRHLVSELFARGADGAELLHAIDVPGETGRYEITVPGEPLMTATLSFKDLRPVLSGASATLGISKVARVTLGRCVQRLESLQDAVHWLGAVRAAPERRVVYQGEPVRLGSTGKEAAAKLAYDVRGRKLILPRVSAVTRKMFGQSIDVRDSGEEFSIEMEPVERAPLRISIADVGEGVSQVLPVLVLGAMAAVGDLPLGAVLAIEQPEMHLHPRAERTLAEFFGEVIKAPSRPRLLIETHSENLLLFVQLLVARGDLKPEDVSILWLETLENGESDCRVITLDARGRPKDWPAGVFSEDVKTARELFLAQRRAPS